MTVIREIFGEHNKMGHLYSPEELARGHIPTAEGYDSAKRNLMSGLQDLVDANILYGAVLVGSVTYADFELGSDIDLFAVTESHSGEQALRDLALQITDSTHVHFDMKAVTKQAAQKGSHRLLYWYAHTTREFCKNWVIGSDPMSIVTNREAWSDIKNELVEDFDARVASLVKSRLHTRPDFGPAHCSLLDRIITVPVYTAIGIVRLEYGGQPSKKGERLSKEDTCRLYKSIIPGEPAEMLFDIIERRKAYRISLLTKPIDIMQYRATLHDIDNAYPLACKIIECSADYLRLQRLVDNNSGPS